MKKWNDIELDTIPTRYKFMAVDFIGFRYLYIDRPKYDPSIKMWISNHHIKRHPREKVDLDGKNHEDTLVDLELIRDNEAYQDLPTDYIYVATNADGEEHGFTQEPVIEYDKWVSPTGAHAYYIRDVELGFGQDWKETLKAIAPNPKKDSLLEGLPREFIYTAIDANGKQYAYSYEPNLSDSDITKEWAPRIFSKIRFVRYDALKDGQDWRHTLRKFRSSGVHKWYDTSLVAYCKRAKWVATSKNGTQRAFTTKPVPLREEWRCTDTGNEYGQVLEKDVDLEDVAWTETLIAVTVDNELYKTMPEEFKFIAVDADGMEYGYISLPTQSDEHGGMWKPRFDEPCHHIRDNALEDGEYWTQTLRFRGDNERQSDEVNQPSHYTQGEVECIDAIKSSLTNSNNSFEGFLKAQVLKYIWRYESKSNPLQDLEKAQWYLNKLIKEHK